MATLEGSFKTFACTSQCCLKEIKKLLGQEKPSKKYLPASFNIEEILVENIEIVVFSTLA